MSAKKRLRQDARRHQRNKSKMSAMKTQVRKFLRLIEFGDVAGAEAAYGPVMKSIYRTAGDGVIHRKTASRMVSRLGKRLESLKAGERTA
jgi:small subunit ribosomal protein S20